MWKFWLSNKITIRVEYFPSWLRILADLEPHLKVESSEYILCQKVFQNLVFQNLCLKSKIPSVDLHASQIFQYIFHQIFASKPDPRSIETDAMLIPWDFNNRYTFLPFCLMLYFLSKIQHGQVPAESLVTPC